MSNGELRISLPIHTVCWIVEKDNLIGEVLTGRSQIILRKLSKLAALVTYTKNGIMSLMSILLTYIFWIVRIENILLSNSQQR